MIRSILAPVLTLLVVIGTASPASAQGGPPGPPPPPPLGLPPVPPQNPQTPQKVLLGKFLFWESQLSSDGSTACATCHIPEFGGSDPRSNLPQSSHPGFDGIFGNADDVIGSIGVELRDLAGNLLDDGVFSPGRQVTGRRAQSAIMAAYAPTLFWDGRAGPSFVDPETGQTVIPVGGALEAQALGPILSDVEMGCLDRGWDEVRTDLLTAVPMERATDLPADMANALVTNPDYPSLFAMAFGTTEITARRIAFAIAAYERALVPNQTPFDSHLAGQPGALTPQQQQGLNVFVQRCAQCHSGNQLTDNQFHNLGVRPTFEDLGRQGVTGNPNHAGEFRTPSLRNVKLRAPFFHNGGKDTLNEVLTFYSQGGDFPGPDQANQINPFPLPPNARNALLAFLEDALTDPRVEQGLPPFDHPTLQRFFRRGDANQDGNLNIGDAIFALEYIFQGGNSPICMDATDANDDGSIDLGDPTSMIARVFGGAPPLPAPSDVSFGPDPTLDGLDCDGS